MDAKQEVFKSSEALLAITTNCKLNLKQTQLMFN